ncbi:hypothetical protein LTR85_002954 [Meristemomyces frigidus]|nr:hypothetical protein LTR85_002954 [Meristemomyces frigidus]
MAACTRALGVTELKERILLHLPLKDLLLAQRVSKEWRDLIQDSQKTRQALFLESTSKASIVFDHNHVSGGYAVATIPAWNVFGKDTWLAANPILNPLLHQHTGYKRESQSAHILHEGFINPVNPRCPGKKMDDKSRATHRAKASWRTMTLMQPAISRLSFFCSDCQHDENQIFDVRGAKLGKLVQGLRDHWHICPNCPYMEEVDNMWTYFGDENTDVVKRDITGWEMLAEFASRA